MKAGRTLGATLGAGFVLAIAVAPHAGPAAHDPAQACHKVELIDRLTNDVITGIEDIEIDLINGMAILSAHDRWALEGALARKSDRLPRGGLYALAMDWSGRPPATISLDDLSAGFTQEKDFSDETAAKIDQEVRRIVEEAEARAMTTLRANRARLGCLIDGLMRHETLSREDIDRILDTTDAASAVS